ncbi:MAG: NUDIX hydrolase [Oscillospiraceae bacterium]
MPDNANTNWCQSVTAVVIRDGKVLLARHTYGSGAGKLIVPGGYLNFGETPQEALQREYLEETGVVIAPRNVIAVRFNAHDWYVAFSADYVSGEARSDGDENSEVVWMDTNEALLRDDVANLTKKLIEAAQSGSRGLEPAEYNSKERNGKNQLFSMI